MARRNPPISLLKSMARSNKGCSKVYLSTLIAMLLLVAAKAHEDPDLHFARGSSQNKFTISPEEPQSAVESFIKHLNGFVHDTVFVYSDFQAHLFSLKQQLSRIKAQYQEYPPWSAAADQVRFAEELFKSMADSAQVLLFYAPLKTKASKLICKTVQLNVKLLTLLDSHGEPDPQSPSYARKVFRSVTLLELWDLEFRKLENPPNSLRFVFHIYYNEAKDKLGTLLKYVP